MVFVHIAPNWFFGYDIIFELVFFIIALSLGLFALKISSLTSQRSVKLFGVGFILIALSYFFQSLFNFFLLSQLGSPLISSSDAIILLILQTIGAYGHVFFMLLGLVVLLYMTFSTKSKKMFLILSLLALVPLLIVEDFFVVFYATSTICFLFIALHYVENYFRVKHFSSLVAALAFVFILIGHAQYFLARNDPLFYVLGHVLELLGYLLVLVNFYLVLKR